MRSMRLTNDMKLKDTDLRFWGERNLRSNKGHLINKANAAMFSLKQEI